jgi:hypothetical protein
MLVRVRVRVRVGVGDAVLLLCLCAHNVEWCGTAWMSRVGGSVRRAGDGGL